MGTNHTDDDIVVLAVQVADKLDKLQPWIAEVTQTRDAELAIACAEFGSMIEDLDELSADTTALANTLRERADPDAWEKLDRSMRAAKPA